MFYEQSKKKIKKVIQFTILWKTIKYLRINLTKVMQDLYTENCNTSLKKIKEDKQMRKHIVFMSWKNKYGWNANIPQSRCTVSKQSLPKSQWPLS